MPIRRSKTRLTDWYVRIRKTTGYRRRTISSFKDKPKKFYSYMRQTQTVKVQVSHLEKEDGKMTESDKEAADELCKFFKSIFIEDSDSGQSEMKIQMPEFTSVISPNVQNCSLYRPVLTAKCT